MKKHTITAYTFKPNDKLYYFDGNDIQTITITKDHLDERYIKSIVKDYLILSKEKVEQTTNDQLILWKAEHKIGGIFTKIQEHYYVENCRFGKIKTPIFVNKSDCEMFASKQ